VPESKTCTPGTNFKLFGFGVSCTWMNIVLTRAAAAINVHNKYHEGKTLGNITNECLIERKKKRKQLENLPLKLKIPQFIVQISLKAQLVVHCSSLCRGHGFN